MDRWSVFETFTFHALNLCMKWYLFHDLAKNIELFIMHSIENLILAVDSFWDLGIIVFFSDKYPDIGNGFDHMALHCSCGNA